MPIGAAGFEPTTPTTPKWLSPVFKKVLQVKKIDYLHFIYAICNKYTLLIVRVAPSSLPAVNLPTIGVF